MLFGLAKLNTTRKEENIMDKDKDNKEGCAGSKCARYNRDSEAELFYSSLTDEELDKWINAVIVGAAAEEGIDYYEEYKDEYYEG